MCVFHAFLTLFAPNLLLLIFLLIQKSRFFTLHLFLTFFGIFSTKKQYKEFSKFNYHKPSHPFFYSHQTNEHNIKTKTVHLFNLDFIICLRKSFQLFNMVIFPNFSYLQYKYNLDHKSLVLMKYHPLIISNINLLRFYHL